MSAVEAPPFIRTIEWDMMDKNKFFPLSMLSSFSIRCCLYPLTVIKTRLQIQRRNHMYTGKWKKPFVFPPHQSFPLNFVFFPLFTYSFEKSLSSIFFNDSFFPRNDRRIQKNSQNRRFFRPLSRLLDKLRSNYFRSFLCLHLRGSATSFRTKSIHRRFRFENQGIDRRRCC